MENETLNENKIETNDGTETNSASLNETTSSDAVQDTVNETTNSDTSEPPLEAEKDSVKSTSNDIKNEVKQEPVNFSRTENVNVNVIRKETRSENSYQNRSAQNQSEFKPMERVIRAKLAVLRENPKSGWKRMITVTQWGGGKFKLDIREWNSEMTRSTKGLTFTRSEVIKLRNVLDVLDLNIIDDFTQSESAIIREDADEEILKAV